MASKLEVLCPNGHRVTVKATPNTTVLQILEEACNKKGYNPDEYNIKHGRRMVDVTMTVRFAGLPNLAKLELVPAGAHKRADQDVMLALQLADGARLQKAFSPMTTLWDVLQHFDQDRGEGEKLCAKQRDGNESPILHPVCVYTREEVIAEEALQAMTLRKLGLTGGKAVIRYQLREVSEQTLEEIHAKLEGEKRRAQAAQRQAVTPVQRPAAPTPARQPPPPVPVNQNAIALSENATNQNRENQSLEMQRVLPPTNTTSSQPPPAAAPTQAPMQASTQALRQAPKQQMDSDSSSAQLSESPVSRTESRPSSMSAQSEMDIEMARPTSSAMDTSESSSSMPATATASATAAVVPTSSKPPPGPKSTTKSQNTDPSQSPQSLPPAIASSPSIPSNASSSAPSPTQGARLKTKPLEGTRSEPVEPVDISDTAMDIAPAPASSRPPRDALDALNDIAGVQVFRPDDLARMNLTAEQERAAREMARAFYREMLAGASSSAAQTRQPAPQRQPQPQPPPQNEFQDFKFPEATRGQNLYHNELSDVKKEDFKPCDREAVLYSKDDSVEKVEETKMETDDDDLPDEFFELTESDIRKLWSDTQGRIRDTTDAPLMTEAMRKAREEERYSKYQRVVIRFHFPDRHILQALFRPRETVYSLQKFVTQHLPDKNICFYLYTSPPKTVLKDKYQNLIEARLAPMSVVYVGFENKLDDYLSSELLSQQTTEDRAAQVLYQHMVNSREQSEADSGPAASTSGPSGSSDQQASSSGALSSQPATSSGSGSNINQAKRSSNSGGKVPKWFKVGKK